MGGIKEWMKKRMDGWMEGRDGWMESEFTESSTVIHEHMILQSQSEHKV